MDSPTWPRTEGQRAGHWIVGISHSAMIGRMGKLGQRNVEVEVVERPALQVVDVTWRSRWSRPARKLRVYMELRRDRLVRQVRSRMSAQERWPPESVPSAPAVL